MKLKTWHPGKDSNPQPSVLETAALPIELPRYGNLAGHVGFEPTLTTFGASDLAN